MANFSAAAARLPPTLEKQIGQVIVEGLVVLKVIKHCQEESAGGTGSDARGGLLGMIRDGVMEVTNCFAFPSSNDEDGETDDSEAYQNQMIKHLRNVNVDHHQVGWYRSNPYGSGQAILDTVDTQFIYQTQCEESVVLMLDPVRTQRGFLSLKAFRLTDVAYKLCKESEFTPETLRVNKMSFDKFFEEIPIKIKNSQLISGLMCELDQELPIDEGKQFLDLGSFGTLEKSVQSLMKCVEDVSKSANWQRQYVLRQQQIAKENGLRQLKNEPPLTEDEMNRILKPPNSFQRLETLLNNCQTLNYCNQASTYSAQNIGKLFLSKALQTPAPK